jgi:signal transduction histidine kinase
MGANYITRSNAGEKATKAATRIVSSAERMARMIDQLLDFTRIRLGGGLALAFTAVDLGEVCLRVKEELEAANPEASIDLAVEGDCAGSWDHDRLLQVFSNLVGNAIAHGTGDRAIAIRAAGDDALRVVVSVHNSGAVGPDVLPVIFEPFRGGTKHLRAQGLGLGGYITRQIVLAHKGEIECSSSETGGTTMRVSLPRSPVGC